MSIDINGVGNSQLTGRVNSSSDDTRLKQQEQAPVATETGKSATTDTLSLSEGARQLGKLDNTAVTAPVIDSQRVEQVKAAISNGEYDVDPVKIASKLMQFESMLKPKS